MKYKVGDIVRVRPLKELQRLSSIDSHVMIDNIELNEPMMNFCGREAVVVEIEVSCRISVYILKFKNATKKSFWYFSEGMLQTVLSPLPKKNRDFNKELL